MDNLKKGDVISVYKKHPTKPHLYGTYICFGRVIKITKQTFSVLDRKGNTHKVKKVNVEIYY